MQHPKMRKGGFTLIEIIVVLAIAALLSSILFAAFKSVSEGNKKASCQSNLVQLYNALRLYGQDNNGEFPLYNPPVSATSGVVADRPRGGLGLWALYAYPASNDLDCDARTTQLPATEVPNQQTPPLASYVRSPQLFHCPYDDFDKTVTTGSGCRVPTTTTTLNSSQPSYKDASGTSYLNPFYNSYQTADDSAASGSVNDNATYSSFRTPSSSRQLVYYKQAASPSEVNSQRRTPDTTVVTWCRFHRKLDKEGKTVDRPSNSDNVLFMDGTVRYLPTTQLIGTTPLECRNWKRIPEETVAGYNSTNPTACPQ